MKGGTPPVPIVVKVANQPAKPTKSKGLAFALAFIFGPLGLLYCSPMAAVILFVLAIITGVLFFPAAILIWLISIFIALTA